MFGVGFARLGFVVANISYRLAPEHPFPAAVQDTFHALEYVLDNAASWGADPTRLAYAGESAGANLIMSLTAAGAWQRPEDYAAPIYARDPRPTAVIPACGFLQVSNPERYLNDESIPGWMRGRIVAICKAYLPSPPAVEGPSLADPLLIFEQAEPPARPLPAVFAPCGSKDPVLDDSVRLGKAVQRFDIPSAAPVYDGGIHSFQAVIWNELARRYWRDTASFLAEQGLVDAGRIDELVPLS